MAHWHWHLCFHIWTSFRIQPLTYSIQNRLDHLRGRFPLSLAGETFSLSRHGKTGGSSSGWVNRVTGQSGCGSIESQVELGCELGRVDPYFSIFFLVFLSRCNLSIVYEFLNYNQILIGDIVTNYH